MTDKKVLTEDELKQVSGGSGESSSLTLYAGDCYVENGDANNSILGAIIIAQDYTDLNEYTMINHYAAQIIEGKLKNISSLINSMPYFVVKERFHYSAEHSNVNNIK